MGLVLLAGLIAGAGCSNNRYIIPLGDQVWFVPTGAWVTFSDGPARQVMYDSYVCEETSFLQAVEVETETPLTDGVPSGK